MAVKPQKLIVVCGQCRRDNAFDQPYAFHAGFADQGFLYSDAGHHTLVWNWLDPGVQTFFPPSGGDSQQALQWFASALRPAPDGSRWRSDNPARCLHCSAPIAPPMSQTIYYLVYPGSIIIDGDRVNLGDVLTS